MKARFIVQTNSRPSICLHKSIKLKEMKKMLLAHEHNLDHCENTFMFNGLEYDFMV
jgi:hypothetical protein